MSADRAAAAPSFRADIEGLRGVAVLLVVLFHSGVSILRGGFIGVDVFFVLSGYLITGLLIAEVDARGRLDLVSFYARRARRLLPASALMLLVTLALSAFVMAPSDLTFTGRAGRATAVYLSNVFFARNASDYFASDVETNPMLHTWSLAVEEQFYLLWPLLLIVMYQIGRSRLRLAWALSLFTLASLVACLVVTDQDSVWAFYGLPTRAWEFGAGGLAALLPDRTFGTSRVGRAGSWAGLGIMVGSTFVISEGSGFPGWVALAPVLGTVAVLATGARRDSGGATGLLSVPPLQTLGRLSYSWYLWHWPALVLGVVLFPTITAAGKMAISAGALVIAAVTHRLVENPVRFHPSLVRRPGLTLALATALSLGGLAAATLSMQVARRLELRPDMMAVSAASRDIARLDRTRCVTLGTSQELRQCDFGDANGPSLALFGDSHAIQWFNPIERTATARGWRLTTFLKSGCPATDVRFGNCTAWRQEAIRRIVRMRPAVVIIGSSVAAVQHAPTTGIPVGEWEAGTRRTLEPFIAAGARVMLLHDVPHPPFNVPTCVARLIRHPWIGDPSCDFDREEAVKPFVTAAERSSAHTLPGVHFFDVTDSLCDAHRCRAMLDAVITYRDDNHITGAFADRMKARIEAALVPLFAGRMVSQPRDTDERAADNSRRDLVAASATNAWHR